MSDDVEERLTTSLLDFPGPTAESETPARQRALAGAAEAHQNATRTRRWRFPGVTAPKRAFTLAVAAALPSVVLGAVIGVLVWPRETQGEMSPYPGPTFTPAEGWTTVESGVFPANSKYAPSAWATNVAVSGNPFGIPLNEGPLRNLPPEGIVILTADLGLLPAATREHTYVDRPLPLQISDAQIQSRWLGQPNDNVPQYVLLARAKGQWIDVRIYFGRQDPSLQMLEAAQRELDRLNVPDPDLLAGLS